MKTVYEKRFGCLGFRKMSSLWIGDKDAEENIYDTYFCKGGPNRHTKERVVEGTIDDCSTACSEEPWCKSFDVCNFNLTAAEANGRKQFCHLKD